MPIARQKEVFVQLQATLLGLESEIKADLREFDAWKEFNKSNVILEKTKTYHYSQITALMGKIKQELGMLLYHDRQVKVLNEKLHRNESVINLRENKSTLRKLETPVQSSMKDLEDWERIVAENGANFLEIKKRHGSFREDAAVSSTVDALLDEYPLAGKKHEEMYKSADCIFSHKPKIVGVVLKRVEE